MTDTADIRNAINTLRTHVSDGYSMALGEKVDKIADELGRLVEGHKAEVGGLNLKLDKCMVQDTCAQANIDALRDDLKRAEGRLGALRRDGMGNGHKRLCDSLANDRRNLRDSLDHMQAGYAHNCADNEALRDRIKELEADK